MAPPPPNSWKNQRIRDARVAWAPKKKNENPLIFWKAIK